MRNLPPFLRLEKAVRTRRLATFLTCDVKYVILYVGLFVFDVLPCVETVR